MILSLNLYIKIRNPMKMLKISLRHSIAVAVGMLAISACVNEEYDLSKDIDTEMTVLKNISMPVGDLTKVTISDLLNLDNSDGSLIRMDDKGNYVFNFSGDEISLNIDVPEITIGQDGGIHTEPIEVHFGTGIFAGMSGGTVGKNIVYSEQAGKPLDTSMDIEIDSELPSQVSAIKSMTLDASLDMKFSVNAGSVHLSKGFEFDFPSYMHLVKKNAGDESFTVLDDHRLVIESDINITADSPLALSVTLDRIDVPEGAVTDGYLNLSEKIYTRGDFYIDPIDFDVIPDEVVIDIKADITDLDIISTEVKLNVNETVPGSSMEVNGMPDILGGGDVCLDIYNPVLRFTIDNSTPFSFNVKADISAKRGDNSVSLALGNDPEINIPASTTMDYTYSRRGENPTPEIGEMISMVPETISFENIVLASTGKNWVKIVSGRNYSASISYGLNAPLAFGEDMKFGFTYDIDDLNLNVALSRVTMSLNIENTVPIDLKIGAVALDENGNEMKDVEITVNQTIAAGTHTSPVLTDVVFELESQRGTINLNSLKLNLEALAPSGDMLGITLNKEQGFAINDVVVTLPDGITIPDTSNE